MSERNARRDFVYSRVDNDRPGDRNRTANRTVDDRDGRPGSGGQINRDNQFSRSRDWDNRMGDNRGRDGDRQASNRNRSGTTRPTDFDVGRRRVDDAVARNWNRDGRDNWDHRNRDRDDFGRGDRNWDRDGDRDHWNGGRGRDDHWSRDHRNRDGWNRDNWNRDIHRWASHGRHYWYAGYRPWHRGWHHGYWSYWRPGWYPWAWYGWRSLGWWGAPLASYYYYNPYCTPYYGYGTTTYYTTNTYYPDYSQPIPAQPAETVEQQTVEQQAAAMFDDARDLFTAQDYGGALAKADQAIKLLPSDAALHEFRALCQFALGSYKEAAAGVYAVLSAGPGWNWETMANLYGDLATYTGQLRALETYAKQNPDAADARFLLAYHYLITGHPEQAARALQRVVELQPDDKLAASLLKTIQQPPAAQSEPPLVPPQGGRQSGQENQAPLLPPQQIEPRQ